MYDIQYKLLGAGLSLSVRWLQKVRSGVLYRMVYTDRGLCSSENTDVEDTPPTCAFLCASRPAILNAVAQCRSKNAKVHVAHPLSSRELDAALSDQRQLPCIRDDGRRLWCRVHESDPIRSDQTFSPSPSPRFAASKLFPSLLSLSCSSSPVRVTSCVLLKTCFPIAALAASPKALIHT